MNEKLRALKEKLEALRKQLAAIFEEMGPERDLSKVKSIEGDNAAKALEIKRRNDELTAVAKEIESLEDLEAASGNVKRIGEYLDGPANRPPHTKSGDPLPDPRPRSLEQILKESASYKAFRERGGGTAVIELSESEAKALLTLTDINNQATRRAGIVPSAQEERTVRDLMLQGATDNNTLTYMEETTFTNAAATVAEGGTKPESALDFTERTDIVRKIATWIPATAELLADVAGIRSYIEGRLMFMVRRTEETQLLLGDGVAPNILGVQVRTGVQTQALGTDPVFDAIFKAITKVRNTGFAEPNGLVMHPNDWQGLVLTRTADGLYILGNPANEPIERVWGLTPRITTAETEGTALVGAFTPMAQVFQREGITITVSTEHSTFFVENKVAILAEERLALAVYRPAAFCTVTGI